MKNTFLFLLSFSFLYANGQSNSVNTINQQKEDNMPVNNIFKITKLTNNQISGWYNVGDLLDNAGAALSYYRTELFPDSTVMVEYDNDWGSPWQHSVGQVFHPTSVWSDFGPGMIDENTTYVLDSISIPYRYFRFQDSVEDTLIIQIYPESSTEYSSPSWGNYVRLYYDYQNNLGENPLMQDTFLLNMEDTAMLNKNYIDFPVGISIGPNQYFATTMSYKPGNPYSTGDTLDPYATVSVLNPINAFLCYYFVDEGFNSDFENEYSFYHGLTAPTSVRYNENENGWNGKYIPGNAWNSGDYHYDMWFHLTTIDLGLDNKESIAMRIFPNPANEDITLYISSNENEKVEFLLLSIHGKTLYQKDIHLTDEVFNYTVNVAKLPKGIYSCIIKGNHTNLVEKIIVN